MSLSQTSAPQCVPSARSRLQSEFLHTFCVECRLMTCPRTNHRIPSGDVPPVWTAIPDKVALVENGRPRRYAPGFDLRQGPAESVSCGSKRGATRGCNRRLLYSRMRRSQCCLSPRARTEGSVSLPLTVMLSPACEERRRMQLAVGPRMIRVEADEVGVLARVMRSPTILKAGRPARSLSTEELPHGHLLGGCHHRRVHFICR